MASIGFNYDSRSQSGELARAGLSAGQTLLIIVSAFIMATVDSDSNYSDTVSTKT